MYDGGVKIVIATGAGGAPGRLEATLGARHALERVAPEGLLARLMARGCDLVLIEGVEGAETLCERVRAVYRALPVMVVTLEGDVAARVRALEGGADDALSPPWIPTQVAARVDALGRRAALVPADPEMLEADGCRIDLGRGLCERDGRSERLTAREVAIVRWLVRHRDRAVGRSELLEHVFGVAPTSVTRSVDVAIGELRKKIERDPTEPRLVVSWRGLGYAWGPGLTQPLRARRRRVRRSPCRRLR